MRSLVFLLFIADIAVGKPAKPKDYSSDLFPIMRTVVKQVCNGTWGREVEPPDWFVSDALDMFHFQRIDLDSDGVQEVITTTGGPKSDGDIFIFKREKDGWSIIGNFDGYGGYTVTNDIADGYRTIRTQHFDTPEFKTLRVVTYTFQGGRYQASTFRERVRDRSRGI